MKVTVYWEDQSSVGRAGFGPHELLISCVADLIGGVWHEDRERVKTVLIAVPAKGNSKLRSTLRRDIDKVSEIGPVFAVIDRDKVRELWKKPGPMPPDCIRGICERLRSDAPGTYDLILLDANIETLVDVAATACDRKTPAKKPDLTERDGILGQAAWVSPPVRSAIRDRCPSFDRLVRRVHATLTDYL